MRASSRAVARVAIVALAVLGSAALQAPAAPAPAAESPLQSLNFLVGHCWRGTFPDGKSVDTHCFESLYGQFVRDRHIVLRDGPDYCGESIYWWDPSAKAVTYRYFNSDGGSSTGTMSVDGERLRFGNEEYTGPDGAIQKFRTAWQREGAQSYVALTEQQKKDGWEEAWKIRFARLAPGVAGPAAQRAAQCAK